MDHYKESWELIKGDLVPWIVLLFVFSMVNSFTGGLGMFLLPNLFRAVRNALAEQRSPEIGELFEFDAITDDVVTVILQNIANMIGMMVCCVGIFATMVLFFFAPMMAADGDLAPMDIMKGSMAFAKANFGEIFTFILVGALVNFAGALLCGIGTFVTIPVTFVASWRFYEMHKEAILAAADAEGLPRKA